MEADVIVETVVLKDMLVDVKVTVDAEGKTDLSKLYNM